MKLYYSKGACSLAVRIILNELGCQVTYEAVNLKNKQTEKGKDYLQINPKGAVPVLELDNNIILTENAVILQYLADFHCSHLLPHIGEFQRYRVLEVLNYITTEIHKSCGALFNNEIPQELKDKIFIPLLKKKFKFMSDQLKDKKFLMGDDFMLPDAYLFVMLLWLKNFKIDRNEWPNLARYFDEMKQRPSIQKALSEEGIQV